jgi:hypothetical protein
MLAQTTRARFSRWGSNRVYRLTALPDGPLTLAVEAADRAAVERFHRADPFHDARIWDRVTITGFQRRQG